MLVAFSGGADSTALLRALAALAPLRGIAVVAAHLDHGMDPGSARRALLAAGRCRSWHIPLTLARRPIGEHRHTGESLEEAARRVRYGFLEEVRQAAGARYVATAHHTDDQAETLLLRLSQGSGLAGLASIQAVQGNVVRPLLAVRRSSLTHTHPSDGPEPIQDPTNQDLRRPRNHLRHRILPRLEAENPGLVERLARLADRAAAARGRIEEFLTPRLSISAVADGVAVSRAALEALPPELLPWALLQIHRRAGVSYPAGAGARRELLRQLAAGGRVGCDCGRHHRWESRGSSLVLRTRGAPPESYSRFTYTFAVPGEVLLEELASRLRVGPAADGETASRRVSGNHRVELFLPLAPGDRIQVRNRLPGDRMHPDGAPGRRRLKEVLIDRRVPRHERDRLPLLVIGGQIAWVPGVAVEEGFRHPERGSRWIVEWLPV